MSVKISARAWVDLLADKITAEQFRFPLGERDGEKNLFRHWLDLGMTLSNVEVDPNIDQFAVYWCSATQRVPAAGKRIKFSDNAPTVVIDGPFAETKELVARYWILAG
jgi:hypothetical protein